MGRIMLVVLAALTMTAACAEEDLDVGFHGVVIHVADMDAALDFYSSVIGFGVAESVSESLVRLESDTPLYLLEAGPERPAAAGEARTVFVLQTGDLDARIAEWRAKGVAFAADAPGKVGVGRSIPFRDPFGALHSLLQQEVGDPAPVKEPVMYNVGFYHADALAAQDLYVDALGFVVRTTKYYPPAIPLGHADGSFAFMLHKRDVGPAVEAQYASGTGAVLIFTAPDLEQARRALERKGVEFVAPVDAPGLSHPRLAFRDREGVVSEIWERP